MKGITQVEENRILYTSSKPQVCNRYYRQSRSSPSVSLTISNERDVLTKFIILFCKFSKLTFQQCTPLLSTLCKNKMLRVENLHVIM